MGLTVQFVWAKSALFLDVCPTKHFQDRVLEAHNIWEYLTWVPMWFQSTLDTWPTAHVAKGGDCIRLTVCCWSLYRGNICYQYSRINYLLAGIHGWEIFKEFAVFSWSLQSNFHKGRVWDCSTCNTCWLHLLQCAIENLVDNMRVMYNWDYGLCFLLVQENCFAGVGEELTYIIEVVNYSILFD